MPRSADAPVLPELRNPFRGSGPGQPALPAVREEIGVTAALQQLDQGYREANDGYRCRQHKAVHIRLQFGNIRLRGDVAADGLADRGDNGLGLAVVESGFLEGFDGFMGVECQRAHVPSMGFGAERVKERAADELLAAPWRGYRFALAEFKRRPAPDAWRTLRRAFEAWKVAFTAESREGDG